MNAGCRIRFPHWLLDIRELSREDLKRATIEEHKLHPLERRLTAEMRANFLEHRLGASLDWKTRDTGADGRERDRLE